MIIKFNNLLIGLKNSQLYFAIRNCNLCLQKSELNECEAFCTKGHICEYKSSILNNVSYVHAITCIFIHQMTRLNSIVPLCYQKVW